MRGGFRSTEGPGKPLEEVDDDNESSELKTLPDYLSSFVSTSTIVLLPARNIRPQHVTQLTMIYLPDPPPQPAALHGTKKPEYDLREPFRALLLRPDRYQACAQCSFREWVSKHS